jgi:hypothetical protein
MFFTKIKLLPSIDGIRLVGGKSHSTPWLFLAIRLMKMLLAYLQKSIIYVIYIATYPPSGAHRFNDAWTMLYTLREHINIL